jgi:hypothetical protein
VDAPETPEIRHAQEALHEKIQELRGALGPFLEEGMNERALLSEFVVVMGWTDAETGENTITMSGSVNLLRAHRKGLLWMGLHEIDADDGPDDI